MASPFILLGLFLPLQCGIITSTPLNQIPQPYIVYMGRSSDNDRGENAEAVDSAAHLQLLSSIIPSQESARVEMKHHYSHAFKGFSAMLTKNEASTLSGHEKIISVFPDPMLKLHTTRSWDFLAQESGFRSSGFPHAVTTDVIIGVIDTASSIDRDFESTVLLGNGISFRGTAINFSNLTASKTYPLAYGADVASKFTPPSEASNCYPGSLDPKKAAGKIIVCVNSMPIVSKQIKKLVVEDAGAKGLIFIDEFEKGVPFDSGAFPFTTVGNDAGVHIIKYINKSRKKAEERKEYPYVHSLCIQIFIYLFREPAAITSNNIEKPLTNSTNGFANPHDMGAGELSPLKALNPGLVYETTAKDYLYFLCYYGYPENKVRAMSKLNFSCPKSSSEDLISNINYPSISIGHLSRNQGGRTIKRTLTNVALQNSTYIALIQSPKGLLVKVSPKKITYREGIRKASFKATFYGRDAQKGYNFGTITWFDGLHHVRTIFAVNVQ
ncbi:Peptidase S8 propeptide/proteinase inhibitor I9 [Dillenia turbinata]|uniref:Peptidase S8 propeptide/proteinase inhibitor I9 n=1 Tax=Dillenia turbinata TaxID=194707 RepID=A0AAN8ZDR6_9MAGN